MKEYHGLKEENKALTDSLEFAVHDRDYLKDENEKLQEKIALLKEQLAEERKKMMDMRDEESILQGKLEIAEYEITRLMER